MVKTKCKIFFIFSTENVLIIKKACYICTRNQVLKATYWRNGRAVECGSLENC